MSNEKQVEEQVEEVVEETVDTENQQEETVEESVEATLQTEIDQLKQQLEEQENRYVRLQADFDNFRRRSRLDAEAAQKYRAQSLVTDILPALDNFDRALQVNTEDENTKSVMKGVEMVYRQLVEALQKEGVEAIESVGKPFDPYEHQAVMQVEDEAYESNTVVEELQKGYKLKDKIIRPAMVKVNQ